MLLLAVAATVRNLLMHVSVTELPPQTIKYLHTDKLNSNNCYASLLLAQKTFFFPFLKIQLLIRYTGSRNITAIPFFSMTAEELL